MNQSKLMSYIIWTPQKDILHSYWGHQSKSIRFRKVIALVRNLSDFADT